MTELDNYDSPQEALDDRAEDLNEEVARLDSALNQYEEGWRDEEGVLEIGEEANAAYDALDEVETAVLNEAFGAAEAVESVESALQAQGYDSISDYIHGREPMSAGNNQDVSEALTEDEIDWSAAHSAREHYNEVTAKAHEEHGIQIPLPEAVADSEVSDLIDGISEGEIDPEDISLS
jgi:sugar-specific transcriptional regulator TrmB